MEKTTVIKYCQVWGQPLFEGFRDMFNLQVIWENSDSEDFWEWE